SGVDVGALAIARVDQAAIQVGFAGVMHGEERRVAGIEVAPVIEAAFLDPVVEVGGGDFVGRIEKKIGGLKKFLLGCLIGDAGSGTADFCGIRSGLEFVPDEIAVVLNDQRAAGRDVVEKALVRAGEFGAEFVGTHADNDGVVFG